MNVLAVIPARAGSFRVKHKNIRECGGKPLLVWSIEAALASTFVTRVMVSSESDNYRRIAADHGAQAIDQPGASAVSRIEGALLYAVSLCDPMPDLVVTLQPTSPMRAPDLIDRCITHLALRPRLNSVATAYRANVVWERYRGPRFPPYSWRHQFGDRQIPQGQDVTLEDQRWVEDGSVFVTRTAALLASNDRRVEPMEPIEVERTVDVDSEEDFLLADMMLRARVREEVA